MALMALLARVARSTNRSTFGHCDHRMPATKRHRRQSMRLHWRTDFDWGGLHIVGAAMTRHPGLPWRMTARLPRRANRSRSPTGDGQPRDPQLASLMAARARAVMEEHLIVMLITDLKA